MVFSESKTKVNLMRAFAGESQARNRYTFAAEYATEHGLYALSEVFLFTANQEKAHAKAFYDQLKEFSGENINIEGGYPVEVFDNMVDFLEAAKHNEYSEYESVYSDFAAAAKQEGFHAVSALFANIAKIEKIHGDRFDLFLQYIKGDKLFKNENAVAWFCNNCGYIHYSEEAPAKCPVCLHDRGYFIRPDIIAYTPEKIIYNPNK